MQLSLVLLPYLIFLKVHRKPPDKPVVSCSSPLCTNVDVSLILPRTFLVLTALQVRPAFGYLFCFHRLINAWHDTTNHMYWILPCVLIYGTYSLILHGISTYASDGVYTYRIKPYWFSLWQCFLRSRGRLYLKAYRMVHQRFFASPTRLFPIQTIPQRMSLRLSSTYRRGRRAYLAILLLLWTGLCTTCACLSQTPLQPITTSSNSEIPSRPQAFTLAYTSDKSRDQPVSETFEPGSFFVLMDNCANCAIATERTDFIEFRPSEGHVNGVGNAEVKGEGTVHWQLKADDEQVIDIIIENALFVPSMEYKIVSIRQWGRQRTAKREDRLPDRARVYTDADQDLSVVVANRNEWWATIYHTNGLPKARCTHPKTDYKNFSTCFDCYSELYEVFRVARDSQSVRRLLQPTRIAAKPNQDTVTTPSNVPKLQIELDSSPQTSRGSDPQEPVLSPDSVRSPRTVRFVPDPIVLDEKREPRFDLKPSSVVRSPRFTKEILINNYQLSKDIEEEESWKPIYNPKIRFKPPVEQLDKTRELPRNGQSRDTAVEEPEPAPKPAAKVSQLPTIKAPSSFPNKLTPSQQLLAWHLRLGHMPFGVLKNAAKLGLLPKALQHAENPMCPSCLYGMQARTPWRFRNSQSEIKPVSNPGDCVSIDQLISPLPGFVAQNTGRLTRQRYNVATVFVDHASRLGYVHIQNDSSAEQTIAAKRAFERYAQTLGVVIKHYHCDNGIFKARDFLEEVYASRQTISFCGVNAHHQNGVAEHRIRTLTESARTQLQHAIHHNPKSVTVHLWPYALRHASYLFNQLPRVDQDRSPLAIFSDSTVLPNPKHLHPFGCPVCVLADKLQRGSQPKWDPHSRVGVYLGQSPHHATSVGLILSLKTGLVSPQFHCVYDDYFETPHLDPNITSHWQTLAHFDTDDLSTDGQPDPFQPDPSLFQPFPHADGDVASESEGELHTPHDDRVDSSQMQIRDPFRDDPNHHDTFTDDPTLDEITQEMNEEISLPPPISPQQSQTQPQLLPQQPMPSTPPALPTPPIQAETPDTPATIAEPSTDPPLPLPNQASEPTTRSRGPPTIQDLFGLDDNASQPPQRPKRTPKPRDLLSPKWTGQSYTSNRSYISELRDQTMALFGEICFESYAMTQADPDTMTLAQAMNEPDADKFLEAMIKEVNDHVDRKHWKLVHRSQARSKPIMAVWSMKRKRNPIGEIVKYKARLCAHGGQTVKGIHYENTFAPVVTWTTIRLMLILSLIYDWDTRQIDFVLAYPQAKASHDIFMLVPERFEVRDNNLVLNQAARSPWKQEHRLKLLQNLYGLKDAGATWYEHLKKGLFARKFTQSQVDPCLFHRDNLILVIYVDDCICMSPDPRLIDKFIADMKRDYILEDEGDINAYLGINVTRPTKDTIKLNQPALTKRIVDSLQLTDQRQHQTPADRILTADKKGPPRKSTFHYRSLIGQLNYLTASTRPDVLYAVHQCARFCNEPRHAHDVAAKRIVRYLKGTMDEGIILQPDRSKGFECYVDADFAGSWSPDQALDPAACLSRTGYVIFFAGCPIIWSSKMQNTIALSTTEAEYTALSTAMRDIIYLLNLVDEFKQHGITISSNNVPTVTCRVFEDNVGALELANTPKLRPRTKHLAVQLHHFRSYIHRKQITVERVATKHQLADIFTKPLPRDAFQYLRSRIIGW